MLSSPSELHIFGIQMFNGEPVGDCFESTGGHLKKKIHTAMYYYSSFFYSNQLLFKNLAGLQYMMHYDIV